MIIIRREMNGKSVPKVAALIQSVECERGRTYSTTLAASGSASIEKMVPERNDIGVMTRVVNRFNVRCEFAIIPANTPRSAYVSPQNGMIRSAQTVSCMSSVIMRPMAYRIAQLMRLLTIPAHDFPRMTARGFIEHRNSSSKLL